MFTELKDELQKRLDGGISRNEAIEHVINLVMNNKPVTEEVIKEAVNIAATYTVSKALTEHRKAICLRAESISRQRKKGADTLREKIAGLMDFRLPGGLALSEATGPDCMDAYNYYMTASRTQYHRAWFLHDVANKVGDRHVKDVLKEDDLQRCYENARRLP